MIKYNLSVSNDNLSIDQIYTKNSNKISFYISLIDENIQITDEIIIIKIIGIHYKLLESLNEFDGIWYIECPNVRKYSFYDIIDIASLNLFKNISESTINIPIKWNKNFKSITGNLFIKEYKSKNNPIYVVGMKHSGSTLLWNILRTAYKKLNILNENENESDKINVHKSHTVPKMKDKKCHIITTIRDVRDTAISGFLRFYYQKSINEYKHMDEEILKYGLMTFIEYMHENLDLFYDSFQNHNVIIFKYEDYKKNPIHIIKNIFDKLGIYSNESFIQLIINEAESIKDNDSLCKNLDEWHFKNENDPNKLLTKDHNTSNGKTKKYIDFFSKEQNEIILQDKRIYNFLKKYDYISDFLK
jgi:hypothetical protein